MNTPLEEIQSKKKICVLNCFEEDVCYCGYCAFEALGMMTTGSATFFVANIRKKSTKQLKHLERTQRETEKIEMNAPVEGKNLFCAQGI